MEYPNHLEYKLGENPHSYGSHFAYWGAFKPGYILGSERNQSCVVSGGRCRKDSSMRFIMKYLKKLSDWRKIELKEVISGADITSLVAGVSPFLEAFGNAKTNMNDNSSRFGNLQKYGSRTVRSSVRSSSTIFWKRHVSWIKVRVRETITFFTF